MSLGAALRKVAGATIANPNLGTPVTYRHVKEGVYDAATGTVTSTPPVIDTEIRAVVEPFDRRFVSGTREDSTLVQQGDLQVTAAASAFTLAPTTKSRFVIDGVVYGIVNFDADRVGSDIVTYGFHVRRGA